MRYEYRKTKVCTGLLKDKSGNRWAYIPKKEIKDQDIDVSAFFGDINEKAQQHTAILVSSKGEINVSKYQLQLKGFEKIIGYIPCVDENGQQGYIRIVKKKYTSLGIGLAVAAVLLVIISGITLWAVFREPAVKVDLDETAIAYQMPDGLKNTDPNQISMPTFNTITMQFGTRDVDITLLNPEGNPCYFRFTIFLKASGKQIFETKWLMPGTAIIGIAIAEDLAVGEYPISIHVDTGMLNDPEQPLNNGVIEATLKVVE